MSIPLVEKGYQVEKAFFWGELPDLEEAPQLIWPKSVSVYRQMRRESQIAAVLRALTLPVRRTPWRLAQNGASDEVTQFCADDLGLPIVGQEPRPVLRTRDRFSWSEHLRLALTMLPYGHSFFEQQYRMEGGKARLRKLAWRPPSSISDIKVARDGGLEGIRQHDMKPDDLIETSRLVAYVLDREGGGWRGQSILRPAYGPWWLKDKAQRVQHQVSERNGLGIPSWTAPPLDPEADNPEALREKQLEAGRELVKALRAGENAGVANPDGAKLELMGVSGTLPKILDWIRYLDEQIARAVLAGFLTLGGAGTQGSFALSESTIDFFVLSLQTLADDVADVATMHIVEDMVDHNFGPDVPAPRVVHDEIGSRQALTAEAIYQLIQVGALVVDEPLRNHVRTTYGLPAADPNTAVPYGPAQPKETV